MNEEKIHWLKESSDGNPAYFHKVANGRRRANNILSIVTDGVEVTEQQAIDKLSVDYYKQILGQKIDSRI